MKQLIKQGLKTVGLAPYRVPPDPLRGASDATREIIARCRPFTLTSTERLIALTDAVEYIVANNIPGDFVECGVWKGGSSMAAALAYLRLGRAVDLHLYDTYDGMSEPTGADVCAGTGESAKDLLARAGKDESIWCYSPLDEVTANLTSTGYPAQRMHFVKGKVEDTIPAHVPEAISILRLDTDWYESTKHELEHLFPRLSHGGILILDDYGFWTGARKAVDEYLAANNIRLFLSRIDYSGRIAIKC